jgi:hypothetical protein
MKLYTLAQSERDLLAVRGNVPALGQVTHNLLIVVQVKGQKAIIERSNGLREDIGALSVDVKVWHALMHGPDNGPASIGLLSSVYRSLSAQSATQYHEAQQREPPEPHV